MKRLISLIALLVLLGVAPVPSAFATEQSAQWEQSEQWDDWADDPSALSINGFAQFKALVGRQDTSTSRNDALLRFESDYQADLYQLSFKGDMRRSAHQDAVHNEIRELALTLDFTNAAPGSHWADNALLRNLSLRLGRQTVTWGLGDLLFVNDLFSKNWQAFFDGQDNQYLKQASDGLKLSYFSQVLSLDVVYQPRFSPDTLVGHGAIVSQLPQPQGPSYQSRVYVSKGQGDYAFYVSDGWATQPIRFNDHLSYAHQQSIGVSLIKPLAGGLFKVEWANYWQQSLINQQKQRHSRWLIGYEWELAQRLMLAVQAYQENDSRHFIGDDRQILTARFTHRSHNSLWSTQVMFMYSPNHHDRYIRANTTYRHSDSISVSFGANLLSGQPTSFFGALAAHENIYTRLTYFY